MININNKRWDKVRGSDIKKVLEGSDDESFFYEFKSDDEEPSKLIKEVSALANTYGGYIFLGINDDKSIGGCKKWTEQRIHATIHDSLTPTPSFDVRKFTIEGKRVFIIKVEEGTLPPYITSKGAIYERVSSGSFPIKDSARLTQLYNKRADQESRIKAKIELGEIDTTIALPNNLCGYIDIGFSVTCSDSTYFQRNYDKLDLSLALPDIVGTNTFSVSRVGAAYMFTIGRMSSNNGSGNSDCLYIAGLHDYLVVYPDCSATCRILLFSDNNGNDVDISALSIFTDAFKSIYKLFCGDDFHKIFIHAQRYEALKVIKQFVPVYRIERHFKNIVSDPFQGALENHRAKYGNNLIIQSNRVPYYGYTLVDKQWFDKCKLHYNLDTLIDELLDSSYIHLGYIDPIKATETEQK